MKARSFRLRRLRGAGVLLLCAVVLRGGGAAASSWLVTDVGTGRIVVLENGAVTGLVHDPTAPILDLRDLVISQPAGVAYVATSNENPKLIDLATKSVTGYIDVPRHPDDSYPFPPFLSLSPDGSRAYVIQRRNDGVPIGPLDQILVVDTYVNQIVQTIAITGGPFGITVTPDNATGYVVTHAYTPDGNGGGWEIQVVDMASGAVTMVVPVYTGDAFLNRKTILSPDGTKLYGMIVDDSVGGAFVMDTQTFAVQQIDDPTHEIRHPDGFTMAGNRLYVAELHRNNDGGPDKWVVVDLDTEAVIGTIDVPHPDGRLLEAMGTNLDGTEVYAAFFYQHAPDPQGNVVHSTIVIIDTATDTIIGTVADPDHEIVYARNAVDPYPPVLNPLKCVAAKRTAVGKAVAAKAVCVSKAKRKAVAVDPTCLAKADLKFELAFTKAGPLCAGELAELTPLVDACAGTMDADTPGTDVCPANSHKAAGKTVASLMSCSARDVKKPGKVGACKAKFDAKLASQLVKLGSCAAPSTGADADQCMEDFIRALPRSTVP